MLSFQSDFSSEDFKVIIEALNEVKETTPDLLDSLHKVKKLFEILETIPHKLNNTEYPCGYLIVSSISSAEERDRRNALPDLSKEAVLSIMNDILTLKNLFTPQIIPDVMQLDLLKNFITTSQDKRSEILEVLKTDKDGMMEIFELYPQRAQEHIFYLLNLPKGESAANHHFQ